MLNLIGVGWLRLGVGGRGFAGRVNVAAIFFLLRAGDAGCCMLRDFLLRVILRLEGCVLDCLGLHGAKRGVQSV